MQKKTLAEAVPAVIRWQVLAAGVITMAVMELDDARYVHGPLLTQQ